MKWKKSSEGFNSRFEPQKEEAANLKIGKLKSPWWSVEKNEQSTWDMWDNYPTYQYMNNDSAQGKKKDKGEERTYEEIIANTF